MRGLEKRERVCCTVVTCLHGGYTSGVAISERTSRMMEDLGTPRHSQNLGECATSSDLGIPHLKNQETEKYNLNLGGFFLQFRFLVL